MTSATTDRRMGLAGNTAYKTAATALATANIVLSGEQTVGGVAVKAVNAAGVPDRVLCVGQTDATTNGLWDVNTGTWTRSIDADGNYDWSQGTQVIIAQGTAAFQIWTLTTANPITVGTTALAFSQSLSAGFLATLAASSGSSLVGFLQAGAGATARTVQSRLRDSVSIFDFMTVAQIADVQARSLTLDVAAAVQAALTYCYSVNKSLFAPSGAYLIGSQLLNKGVTVLGEGRLYSQFVPAITFPAATSIMLVQPDNGAYIDFLELGQFSIQPTNNGVKYGGTAIFMNFQQTTNLSKLHMHDLYLLPGNDYSFQISNNMAVNTQGVPANSTIERCYFAEGSKLIGIGDSNMIHENVFRASGGNRTAIWLYMSDTSGVASHTVIRENNIDCPGGALYAVRGRSIKFIYNNVELSAGSGTPNGTIVDIDGSSGSIPWAEIDSNHIGIFGTATATSAVRVAGAQGCSVDKNTILSGLVVASGILITASAGDTDIGFNEIQSNYTTPINNSGLRTMGVPLAAALLNSFTNTGGGYQALSAYKSRTGLVTVSGVVAAPATPSGLIIATLPLGYRPASIQRFAASTVSGGNIVAYAIEVDTAGNIVCYCAANTTRIEVSATFQTLNYVNGSL